MYLFSEELVFSLIFCTSTPLEGTGWNIGGYSNVTSWEGKKVKNLLGRELLKRANKV